LRRDSRRFRWWCRARYTIDKAQLTRIAAQTQNAYARCINPVGTLADGDTVYASSCGELVEADVNMTGTLAAHVMAKAIENAILSSIMDDAEYLPNCLVY
jgi:L-aminopeptidase/D-esterase-like protein